MTAETTTDIVITPAGDEPGARTLNVEVAPERVRKAEATAAQAFAKRARLPGFRKGKAPLDVVRRRYHDQIQEEMLRQVIGESWKAALAQESLAPIADPHVHDLKVADGEPLTFTFHVEVKPELTLERVGGFTLTRTVEAVTDEAVEHQIDELRRQRAAWLPVEHEQPKPGDMASVSLATLGESGEGDAKPYQVVLGEGQAIPDVEQAIMGLTPGGSVEATVRFPDDFPEAERRGESRQVRITLHEVKRQDVPPLTDEFAREVGDFDSADDLRRAVHEDLEHSARHEADAGLRRQVIEEIVKANAVPAPRPLVQRLLVAYAKGYGVPEDQLDKFAQEFAPIAEAQVRRELILERVIADHELAATEDELDQRVADIATRRGEEPGQVYASLQKANRLRDLERTITEDKAFDYLLSQSTVTEG